MGRIVSRTWWGALGAPPGSGTPQTLVLTNGPAFGKLVGLAVSVKAHDGTNFVTDYGRSCIWRVGPGEGASLTNGTAIETPAAGICDGALVRFDGIEPDDTAPSFALQIATEAAHVSEGTFTVTVSAVAWYAED